MKRYQTLAVVLGFALLSLSSLIFLGCEVGSSDSATRNIGVNFTGFYDSTGTNSDFVTPANSGSRVTSFNLRQAGDQLEAIDNNNIVFRGTVGDPSGTAGTGTAGFQLEGHTTAGQPVTISGTLSGANTSGNSATATMDGTWIEPNLYARILGDAIINAIQTNQPPTTNTTLSISPSGSVSVPRNTSQPFTRQNGTGPFNWSISAANLGQLNTTSGDTVTYQANSSTGTTTIKVSDSTSASATATIIQQ